jgi:orotidine-5'-phosphate decarboxylase
VLDVDDLDAAAALAGRLSPWFGVAKVGLELFSAAGPAAVERLRGIGFDVFLDVKLHDIPTTVGRAATVLGRLGVSYLTIHTSGGTPMLRAGVEGLAAGAASAGHEPPLALGVTVLTSDVDAPAALLSERVGVALAAGCGGVVCAAPDLAVVRAVGPDLRTVVPGIRLAGSGADDQARPATPAAAIAAGASLLVVGRTVTAAPDPEAAAAAVVAEVAAALAGAEPGAEPGPRPGAG